MSEIPVAVDPRIYSSEDVNVLPNWLEQTDEGLFYKEDSLPPEKRGPWHFVADFEDNVASLRDPLALSEGREDTPSLHIRENLATGIISKPFLHITRLANEFPLTDPDVQFLYTSLFVTGIRGPMRDAIVTTGTEGTIVLAPERGGRIIKIMYEANGFTPDQMPEYQASRIILGNSYSVAYRFDEQLPKIPESGYQLHHADDCVAGLGTEIGGVAIVERSYGRAPLRYASVTGVGVRRSLLRNDQMLTARGRSHQVFAGAEANSMDDHYYLSLTPEDRVVLGLTDQHVYRVGDMGDAMNITPQRESDIPIFGLLATVAFADNLVLSAAKEAIDNPNELAKQARELRAELNRYLEY